MRNIYLIGFSGTGKSTVGRLLGARLGLPLRDLDDEIAARAGLGIPALFAREGEAGFRRRETEALRAVAGEGGQVVATGGGAAIAAENRELMAASGWVVCLEALPETLYARLRAQLRTDGERGVRPLLDSPDPLGRIRALKDARQPAYARAHWTVHTDALPPERVAAEVARAVATLAGAGVGGVRTVPLGARRLGRDRPLLCVPTVAATEAAVLEGARRIAALAPDAIELRADYLPKLTPTGAVDLLGRVAEVGLPVIFTNRAEREGGGRAQREDARVAILGAAIESGLPALVDVELATPTPLRHGLLALAARHGVPVILSAHDFARTPPAGVLLARLREMAGEGAAAAKIATLARDENDALRLLAVCRAATTDARRLAIPVVAIGMGPLGLLTRVVGHRAGSALTFAAATAKGGSAPGQPTVGQLRGLWAALGVAPRAAGPVTLSTL